MKLWIKINTILTHVIYLPSTEWLKEGREERKGEEGMAWGEAMKKNEGKERGEEARKGEISLLICDSKKEAASMILSIPGRWNPGENYGITF